MPASARRSAARHAVIHAVGVTALVSVAFLLGACGPESATAGSPTSPAATSGAPEPSAAATTASSTPATRTATSTSAKAVVPDGTSQVRVFAIDVAARTASVQPIAMVPCSAKDTNCTDDYRIETRGSKTSIRIAATATFVAALDGTNGICDDAAIASGRCNRTIKQFADLVSQSERLVNVEVKGGIAVSMKEIFTP